MFNKEFLGYLLYFVISLPVLYFVEQSIFSEQASFFLPDDHKNHTGCLDFFWMVAVTMQISNKHLPALRPILVVSLTL